MSDDGTSTSDDEVSFSPPNVVRRDAACFVVIFGIALFVARPLLWHGAGKSGWGADVLFGLSAGLSVFLAQLVIGRLLSELYSNFWTMSGRWKLVYLGFVLLTWLFMYTIWVLFFPGILGSVHIWAWRLARR